MQEILFNNVDSDKACSQGNIVPWPRIRMAARKLFVEEGAKCLILEHRAVRRSSLGSPAFPVARSTYICAFWNTKYYFLTWDRLEPRHLAKEQIFHTRICRPDLRRAASLT